MSKWKLEQSTELVAKKKSCTQFKDEWLLLCEIVEVEMPKSSEKQKVTLWQIFCIKKLATLSAASARKQMLLAISVVAKSGMSGN